MYSRWVKFIASIAGLCIVAAVQRGCYVMMDLISYPSERALIAKFTGQQDYSLLDFFSSYALKRELLLMSLLGGAGILIGVIAMNRARSERKVEQEQRDRFAEQLAAEIQAGIGTGARVKPFALYLRPFVLEKAFRSWKLGSLRVENALFLETRIMNFDYFLQEHLNYLDMQLVSIGPPDDKRARHNDERAAQIDTAHPAWRETFHLLAENTTTIVVVPGIRKGVLEEIQWLKVTGLLVNTVFFKPRGYPKANWQTMKDFFRNQEEIEFPDYSRRQLSFRISSSGQCYELVKWPNVYQIGAIQDRIKLMRTVLTNNPERFDS